METLPQKLAKERMIMSMNSILVICDESIGYDESYAFIVEDL